MKLKNFRDRNWFPYAVAICIGVLFSFLLNHLAEIGSGLGMIWYFIYPVVAGGILAYIINPLMRFMENRVFKWIRKEKVRSTVSLIISIVFVVVIIIFLIGLIIPQLIDSINTLISNKDMYFEGLLGWLEDLGNATIYEIVRNLLDSSRDFLDSLRNLIAENSEAIQKAISDASVHITAWVIGVVFSVYFLADKKKIAQTASSLFRRLHKSEESFQNSMVHVRRIDMIMTRYLTFSLIDGFIVGLATAIFMLIMRMPYVGLEAVIIGLFNLIPTFGPMIGLAIGTLILLLVDPMQALWFLIYVTIVQTIDGYWLKPKLYGDSLGISGLWVLIAVIVGGRIFGVIGIILSIPIVAIIDYFIKEVWAKRKSRKDREKEEAPEEIAESEGK